MSSQKYIVIGIVIFIMGGIVDFSLVPFSRLPLFIGTVITLFGVIKWMRFRENRKLLKEVFVPRRKFAEMVKGMFDFRWSRISIIWTFTAIVFMTIVHLGGFLMKSNGAYRTAIASIKNDNEIIQKTGGIRDLTYIVTGHFTTNGYSSLKIGVIGQSESFYVNTFLFGKNGVYSIDKIEKNE